MQNTLKDSSSAPLLGAHVTKFPLVPAAGYTKTKRTQSHGAAEARERVGLSLPQNLFMRSPDPTTGSLVDTRTRYTSVSLGRVSRPRMSVCESRSRVGLSLEQRPAHVGPRADARPRSKAAGVRKLSRETSTLALSERKQRVGLTMPEPWHESAPGVK